MPSKEFPNIFARMIEQQQQKILSKIFFRKLSLKLNLVFIFLNMH